MFVRISWLYATFLIFVSLVFVIVFYFILPRPYARKISSHGLKKAIFFTTEIVGKEDLSTNMFLFNHQSDLDIGIMETSTKSDLAWVAKKSLFDIPFFGLSLRWPEDISVIRDSKLSIKKLLKDTKDRIAKGRVIAMSPEGTRSTSGKLLPFKNGAKIIADKYTLRVQPVVIMEASKCYNRKILYYKPEKIKVIFMDSFIANKDEDWLKELRVKMQEVYDSELASNISHR